MSVSHTERETSPSSITAGCHLLSHSPSHDSLSVSDFQFMTASKSASEIRCSASVGADTSLAAISDIAKQNASNITENGGQILSPPWLPRTSRSGSASSSLLTVPSERYGSFRRLSSASGFNKFSNDILFEEETDVIKNCGAFSSAVLGLMKSFSTSDISTIDPFQDTPLRSSYSEIALFGGILWNPRIELPTIRHLDAHSRSCSTWVAVGEPLCSTSQLPSPQTHTIGTESVTGQLSPALTPTELLQSVNKKVRQLYIKRRLLSTYRALERLSRSQLDLSNVVKGDLDLLVTSSLGNKLKAGAIESAIFVGNQAPAVQECNDPMVSSTTTATTPTLPQLQVTAGDQLNANELVVRSSKRNNKGSNRLSYPLDLNQFQTDLASLSIRDVDLQKGKPLTKYERNIMIFNWLQNLDQSDCNAD
ncbi:hypothetical protein B4U79_15920 [Dinothrombium tinctorium]|uniref:Uncharacterized protein n=1 Tax=Dinothrombium tinctorium TaxID=1965070 RepID=A0A443QYE8_9ACAR|nr:hypothetical protein B4U79_15920 [Dinothrombium tinctorium]